LTNDDIKAKTFGRPVGSNRNRLKAEIKAITYHNLKIEKTDDGFKVEIVLDV
jgi:SHS2 domain-containing protein